MRNHSRNLRLIIEWLSFSGTQNLWPENLSPVNYMRKRNCPGSCVKVYSVRKSKFQKNPYTFATFNLYSFCLISLLFKVTSQLNPSCNFDIHVPENGMQILSLPQNTGRERGPSSCTWNVFGTRYSRVILSCPHGTQPLQKQFNEVVLHNIRSNIYSDQNVFADLFRLSNSIKQKSTQLDLLP